MLLVDAMSIFKKFILSCLLFPLALTAMADAQLANFKQTIEASLKKINPNYQIAQVEPSHIQGFYNVQLQDGPLLYVSADAKHFFAGELYYLDGQKMVSITDQDATRARIALMDELNPAEMIIFSPKLPVKTKAHITVFTDVDCFYCQKLHKEVPELNARGIEVRYMAFPRAGVNSASAQKLITAWCSKNPQDAMTRLKNLENLAPITCPNPVAKDYDLGKRMGVNGTPAIIAPDGSLIPGYRPAAELAKLLGV